MEYIAESRTYWIKVKDLEIIKAEERHKGIQKGLDIAEEIFTHSIGKEKEQHMKMA